MDILTVDILMATFNGERYLSEQLDSLRAQTYENWRLLVSDDGSSDGTLALLREYEKRDSRIKVVATEGRHGTAQGNFWSLLPYAVNDRIMFCDQDDVWEREKVEKTLAAMNGLAQIHGDETPLVVFSDMRVVDEDLNLIAGSHERYRKSYPIVTVFPKLLMLNPGAGCSMMFNRSARNKALETTTAEEMAMHDWWMMLIGSAFGAIGYIDEPLNNYRQHADNTLGVQARKALRVPNTTKVEAVIRRHLRQARAFREVYGSQLSLADKKALDHVILSASGGIKGLYHLFASHCWKKSLRRKMGQVYATVFLLDDRVAHSD